MKTKIDILVEKNEHMKLLHTATNDDASTFDYSGEIIVDDFAGTKIHNTNFDNILALLVVNIGVSDVLVQVATDSTPPSSINNQTLSPGDFCFIPKPEYATSKHVLVAPTVSGESSIIRFYVSGD